MIEGMSILSTITKDQSTLQLYVRFPPITSTYRLLTVRIALRLRDTLAATVDNDLWQGDNGIISYGSGHSGDWTMVHALSAVYQRNSTTPDLRNYIRDYLTVQYNALSDLATNGSSIYGSSWIGPAGTQLDAGAQSAALALLISAIPLQNNTDSVNAPLTGSGPTQPSGTPPNSSGVSTKDVAIVGGSVGGTLFLTCLGFGMWWLLLRRRRQQKAVDTPGAYKDYQQSLNGTTLDYLVVSPFTEHFKNRSEQAESPDMRTGGVHQDLKQDSGHLVASTRLPRPPSSHRSNTTSSTGAINELVADVRALRLQHSHLQERLWEEDESPPPEYYSVRSVL
ncbi:hypothetical protein AAF712_009148 [Marasmius tenuissimus]|uniref:Glycoside hydrolase family 76 protein n=1 Tax=Marasmius tenuissimus TaxID=585030 RepID=A0ABR2ZRH3_9AGAR